jgi:hypothetical protein
VHVGCVLGHMNGLGARKRKTEADENVYNAS